ncbi:MAG TPA: glycosyltransferase family 2 protein, partial [Phycisphaerales bacterium]|nr:glycosyltransferase family 2 protein [Phycisphaerales bacterium]
RPAELYFLLNPDTVARPGAVGVLARFLRSHPRAGIAGSRLEYPDGRPQPAAFRAPGLLAELENALSLRPVSRVLRSASVLLPQPVNPIRPDWVSGAAMMVRREVFERVGLLDERYFMYFEELDLCERAGRAGFEVWHVPESRVVHLIGQASGIGRERRRRPAYWFESRRRYWVKNHGVAGAAAADAVRIAGTALHRAGLKVRGRPNWMPPGFLRDLVRHSVFVRGFRT